jgi:DNA modification methylase
LDAYEQFLASKRLVAAPAGFDAGTIPPMLFDYQRDVVRWACKRGRAAIFSRYGTGKTPMQLAWAEQVVNHTGQDVLILAPLAVAQQTKREGEKFGIPVTVCRSQSDVKPGINITNYEMLPHFDPLHFAGIVLDESSILKSFEGKTRTAIIEAFARTPYRLACTATPAPNDHMELGNHAEFLGIMSRTEMLSTFFVHDGGDTSAWRLKGHAEKEFWAWVCSWAVMLRTPSDLGYSNEGFDLPPLTYHQIEVQVEHQEQAPAGAQMYLMPVEALTLVDRRNARKISLPDRVKAAADLVNASNESWIVWCNLNDESKALAKAIPGAVEVSGSDTTEHKEKAALDFVTGKIRVLISKPSIFGFGMNWQHCHNAAYVGLSDSFEQLDQSIHRIHRYGQKEACHVYVITSELEGAVVRNIERKRKDHEKMTDRMIAEMKDLNTANIHGLSQQSDEYKTNVTTGANFTLHLGDCVEMVRGLADNSIDYSIFSPPFSELFVYSNSERDMGNSKDEKEFYQHFLFLLKDLYRVLRPGRLVSFHCMLLPAFKTRDGFIGLKDFRGDLIRMFQEAGFYFHSEVTIWKDPVVAMQRTKAIGLLHKQIKKDSCMSRQGIPDYLVTMKKPGENDKPVAGPFEYYVGEEAPVHTGDDERYSIDVWQRYASPVWFDINQSNTLQKASARENADEKHICPLQLDVIERALQLWTNPDDLVLSPFAGIGSEGFVSIKQGRRFVGAELKQSYYKQAVLNLQRAEREKSQPTLWDMFDSQEAQQEELIEEDAD